jgi:hypothetical protein
MEILLSKYFEYPLYKFLSKSKKNVENTNKFPFMIVSMAFIESTLSKKIIANWH